MSDVEDELEDEAHNDGKRKRDSPHTARTIQAPITLHEEIESAAEQTGTRRNRRMWRKAKEARGVEQELEKGQWA